MNREVELAQYKKIKLEQINNSSAKKISK